MTLLADYYDGKSTRRRVVALRHEHGRLRVCGDDIERVAELHELRVSEPMGDAPRLLTFADGAFCEVRDHAAFQALLDETGYRDGRIVRWQSSLRWIVASSFLCVFALFAAYRWGLPSLAGHLANALPDSVLEAVSDQILEHLDERILAPSQLPAAQQAVITRRFSALVASDASRSLPDHRVVFRANRAIPANALALPSGTVILTDDLVALADNDSQVLAVLAHELGHVDMRHGMRQLIQSSLVGALVAWWVGDLSSLMAAAPAALLEARYSREFELEADVFAARLLAANGVSPRCLAELLIRLENATSPAASGGGRAFSAYLSTHPETALRAAAMQGGRCE